VTRAASVGWSQVPAQRVGELLRAVPAEQVGAVLTSPGLLGDVDAGVLVAGLLSRRDAAGTYWAQAVSAARLPQSGSTVVQQRQRLALAASGLSAPLGVVGPESLPGEALTPLWCTVPPQPSVPLIGHTDWVRAVAAVPLPDGRTLLQILKGQVCPLWLGVSA
jgi:hypothetical protein